MTARDLDEIARNKIEAEAEAKADAAAALGQTKSQLTQMGWALFLIGVRGMCMRVHAHVGALMCIDMHRCARNPCHTRS